MTGRGSIYTRKVIAELLNLSEKRVKQLTEDGIINEYSPGYYKLVPAIQGYIKFLQVLISDDDQGSNYNIEKVKLTKVKRESAELELKQKKNELHKAADIEFIITNMLVAFKSRLLAVPYKVLPLLLNIKDSSNQKDEIVNILNETINECLDELSEYNPEMFCEEKFLADYQDDD